MRTSSTTSFDLRPPPPAPPQPLRPEVITGGLSEDVLLANIFWFIRLRWAVAATLVVVEAVASFTSEWFGAAGLVVPSRWPWVLAAVLAAYNVLFYWWALRLARRPRRQRLYSNLWSQIVLDLLVLTLVVHFVGSVETYIAFAYLFHIVLACIFLPARASLIVTGLSAGLYISCVALEYSGVIGHSAVLADSAFRQHLEAVPLRLMVHVGTAVAIWLVVWYLVSHLATAVRARDEQLSLINRQLLQADQEKTQHMLRTTHELKAPFAAIQSNVQLLLKGYCGSLPTPARTVLNKVDVRCRRLSNQVGEMLQLANLKTGAAGARPRIECDLAGLIRRVVEALEPTARPLRVTIDRELQPVRVVGVRDQLEVLLANVISNAVLYSFEGDTVTVRCGATPEGAQVVVSDHGIGIPQHKVAHIFEEYYRTNEAARHNRMSTGLGLAIVKRIAESHRISIHIDSEVGEGTTFTLRFPAAQTPTSTPEGAYSAAPEPPPQGTAGRPKEWKDGQHPDRG